MAEVAHEGRPVFATEWLVEARDGGTCVVRLINSGFGSGAEWDAEYDATQSGWRLFLYNLRLYLTHFPGQACSSVLVNVGATGPADRAFADLAGGLGLPAGPGENERVAATAPDAPPLAGLVERASRQQAHPAAGEAGARPRLRGRRARRRRFGLRQRLPLPVRRRGRRGGGERRPGLAVLDAAPLPDARGDGRLELTAI